MTTYYYLVYKIRSDPRLRPGVAPAAVNPAVLDAEDLGGYQNAFLRDDDYDAGHWMEREGEDQLELEEIEEVNAEDLEAIGVY